MSKSGGASMNTGLMLTQEQLQKISINQIQSLNILSLSAESLRNLLQKESEENPSWNIPQIQQRL